MSIANAPSRSISTRAAINKGLRASDSDGRRTDSPIARRYPFQDHRRSHRNDDWSSGHNSETAPYGSRERRRFPEVEKKPGARKERYDREGHDDSIPLSLPYTTAASRFLYGYNVVIAALKARRRKLYRLYMNKNTIVKQSGREDGKAEYAAQLLADKNWTEIETLARRAGIAVDKSASPRLLDQMSGGRPHNGLILEASDIPSPPVRLLSKCDSSSEMRLVLNQQSKEELAVNGVSGRVDLVKNSWRRPFVVFLDGITDPGNIGNIIRTCHFFGVDAVAMATNTCAPISSPVLAKASSGACEALPILQIKAPSDFLYKSALNGWRVYAAMAPPSKPVLPNAKDYAKYKTSAQIMATESPLVRAPSILVLGAEGEGLRANLQNHADFFVSIEQARRVIRGGDVGVDSVNVSVAAGILLSAFVREPPKRKTETTEPSEDGGKLF